MKEITFKLNPDYIRPVIRLYGLDALIDTGAKFPVTTISKEILVNSFNAKCIVPETQINGFGGNCTGAVYELETFHVGDLIFPRMTIFQTDEDIGFPFILSAGMFDGLDIVLSFNQKTILFQVPDDQLVRNQHVKDSDGNVWILNASE